MLNIRGKKEKENEKYVKNLSTIKHASQNTSPENFTHPPAWNFAGTSARFLSIW